MAKLRSWFWLCAFPVLVFAFAGCRDSGAGGRIAAAPASHTLTGTLGPTGARATLSYSVSGTAQQAAADEAGAYCLVVPEGWSGVVTPSKPGCTFTPPTLTFTGVTSDQVVEPTVTAAATLTVSGSLGAAGAGATLSWTDGVPRTGTADGSGTFTFTVPYGWTGSLTPSKAGQVFTPGSLAFVAINADQTGQDFTATALACTVSGNAGVAGATLTWTGGTARTVTADGSGTYSLTVPYNESGTLVPSKAGYSFSPASRTFSVIQADQAGQGFTAAGLTYTISGNAGVAGATLSWTDGTARTATADGSGAYTLSVSYAWSGTVTPSKAGSGFAPASRSYSNVQAAQAAQNYTATGLTYTLGGNAGVAGATLSWTDGTAQTATADGTGAYTLSVPYNWSGSVTPSKAGYTFAPASRSYSNVQAAQAAQNYAGSGITCAVSGNAGIPGATLSWTDGTAQTATADGTGAYTLSVSYNWSGTVTPSKAGSGFAPASRSYSNVQAAQAAQNYTATGLTYTLGGNAGVAGATLSWTDGTAQTATADGTGAYTLSVPYNWSGSVTPSKAGYTFAPASRSYSNVQAAQAAQNYTGSGITYAVSGNAGIPGATLSWTDGTAQTATADGTGAYTLNVSYAWSGTVTPAKAGYTFSPASRTYASVLSAQSAQNYAAAGLTYILSGNAGVAGATLSWTDGTAQTATADGSGAYSLTVPYDWTGTLTPSKAGYNFSPSSLPFTGVQAAQAGQDFTATAVTYSINGNAGVAGATLSWTDGTAKTATADGSAPTPWPSPTTGPARSPRAPPATPSRRPAAPTAMCRPPRPPRTTPPPWRPP